MDWSIGELAHRSGVNIETIRYYEREGLMPRPSRTRSGRRAYAPGDLKTLTFIRKARDLGFSLDEIRSLRTLSPARRQRWRQVEVEVERL